MVSSLYVIVLDALATKLVYANSKGEVTYLNVFGQPTLVVDSYDAAFFLLENRSSNTSDRPRLVMAEL